MHKAMIICGYKKSGKTQLTTELIKELRRRGHIVGTVKHIPKKEFTIDQEGTDTWRHAQAGALAITSISPTEIVKIEKRKASLEEELLRIHGYDFVLIEGFHDKENIPKIIIPRNDEEAEILDDEFTIGIIDHEVNGKTVLDSRNIKKIADLIERKAMPPVGGLNCGKCGYSNCKEYVINAINERVTKDKCKPVQGPVILRVDGKQIPIKSFVKKLIQRVLSGIVSSLKSSEGERIEIEVERE